MSAVCAFVALLMLAACTVDSSALAGDADAIEDVGADSSRPPDVSPDDGGLADVDVGDSGSDDSAAADSAVDDGTMADTAEPSECTGAIDGALCAGGICVDESCLSAGPTELGAGALSVYETDSTTGSADFSLDDDRDSRWTSDPDVLPRFIVYRLDRSYYVTGVMVDSGAWSHCGQSDVLLSTDGVTWGSPIARYTMADPLPNGSPALFGSARAAEFIKIEVNARTDGGRYCYIAEIRAIVFDI